MAVPEFQSLMLPILRALADGESHHWREQREACVRELGLTEEDRVETIPSGYSRLDNRVHWAHTHLFQAGLLSRPQRGYMQITDRGRKVLADAPERIDVAFLSQFEEYQDFRSRTKGSTDTAGEPDATAGTTTPWETIAAAVRENDEAVSAELLQRVLAKEPSFLETLVLELLTAMGYGGRIGATAHRQRSGDGGIDGTIRQDELGLDRVFVQTKRDSTDHTVSSSDVQAFVGALHGVQADRGVFVTTSRFAPDAQDFVDKSQKRVVLIDGHRLAELMLLYNVGVQDERTFVLKRIDEDFFE